MKNNVPKRKRFLKPRGSGGSSAEGEDTSEGTGGSIDKEIFYDYTKTYGIANFKRHYKYNGKEHSYDEFFERCDADDRNCTRSGRIFQIISTIFWVTVINLICCYCGGCGICKACKERGSSCCKRAKKEEVEESEEESDADGYVSQLSRRNNMETDLPKTIDKCGDVIELNDIKVNTKP